MKLSVFVITKNEEKKLARCLDSVKWADEIIVVDSLSQDKTVGVATAFTSPHKIFLRGFTDFADQKNFAMGRASGDWLLSIDADEQVTPELAREIRQAMEGNPSCAAYRIRRRSRMFGRWMRFSGTQHDRPIRLFRKNAARFEQPVHERVIVDGTVGCLRGQMLHYTYDGVSDYLVRMNSYTSLEAERLKAAGVRPNASSLLLKPWLMFLKLYFWDRGFCDGLAGFVFCLFSGGYVFLKHAKHREIIGAMR